MMALVRLNESVSSFEFDREMSAKNSRNRQHPRSMYAITSTIVKNDLNQETEIHPSSLTNLLFPSSCF